MTSATSTNTSGGTTYPCIDYTITNNTTNPGGSVFRDFHLIPPDGTTFDTSGLACPPAGTTMPTGWQVNGMKSTGISFVAPSGGVGPGASVTFRIQLPFGANPSRDGPKWKVTTSGAAALKDADIIDAGPTTNDPGNTGDDDTPLRGPPLKMSIIDPDSASVSIGSSVSLTFSAPVGSLSYSVCLSEDPIPAVPVPSAWNLTVSGLSGTLAGDGTGSGSITVPNDGSLVGKTIWVSFKAGPSGGAKTYTAGPISISITN